MGANPAKGNCFSHTRHDFFMRGHQPDGERARDLRRALHEIGMYVLPRSDWFRNGRTPGDKHTEQLFDSTATLAQAMAGAVPSQEVPNIFGGGGQ